MKILKRFYMDKSHPLSSQMVVHSLNVKNDPFRPCKKGEELLVLEVPYRNIIGALMYLANYIGLDIVFLINLLARYNFAPTKRNLNCIKHILRSFRGTTYMIMLYLKELKQQLLGYVNA